MLLEIACLSIVGLVALEMVLNTIIRVVYIWKAKQLSDLPKLNEDKHGATSDTV